MKPNIVFIFSDQHRAFDCGFMGSANAKTPNLDRLAAGGALFRNAYSNCPVCVPARGTLLTGLYPLRHGAAANDIPIRQNQSIAHILGDAGYDTAYIGKWHLGGIPRKKFITEENRLGFRFWRGCNCNHNYLKAYYDDESNTRHEIEGYEPIAQTNMALEFIEERGDDKPFALFICYGTPHDPYTRLPEGELEREAEGKIELRANIEPSREGKYDEKKLRRQYTGYLAHIRLLDEQIGRVMALLEERGIAENTIVVYTSDHGDMLGSHGYTKKQWFYEESVHIPLIVSHPAKIKPGAREQLISLVDIAPTLAGYLNLSFRKEVDGADLSNVLTDPSAKGIDSVYLFNIIPCHQAWNREIRSWRAVVTDDLYMLATEEDGQVIFMSDLKSDPLQTNDLSENEDLREKRSELCEILAAHVERNDGYMPWEEIVKEHGLLEDWNASQIHFGYPTIE